MSNLLLISVAAMRLFGQGEKIRIIAFGAHPDDCDSRASGTAALWAKLGHAVKFVSVTNGDAGQAMRGSELARRRLGEAK
jgi:LmbE family N-acetylglucosaminyl deacetylase